MCSHVQKVSHCFPTVLSLRSLEVERPSVTDLYSAWYVTSASLQMAGGTAARDYSVGTMC